ncbi:MULTISPECIES: hypothetical protein [Cupriavidus]|uniref:hypothetical protein n=1 Tax=Cupriavidus TaxID=106589 RepID=UPI00140FAA72|nr:MULTISPECIES: hypothetical protein [Cupriavidus]QYY29522.1 hypothetical protein K2O51_04845 [Cupriavidus pinatubonensis]
MDISACDVPNSRRRSVLHRYNLNLTELAAGREAEGFSRDKVMGWTKKFLCRSFSAYAGVANRQAMQQEFSWQKANYAATEKRKSQSNPRSFPYRQPRSAQFSRGFGTMVSPRGSRKPGKCQARRDIAAGRYLFIQRMPIVEGGAP